MNINKYSCNLGEISLSLQLTDQVYPGFINMPVWEMLKQVAECKNLQFLFEEFSTLGPNSFQVFNWCTKY